MLGCFFTDPNWKHRWNGVHVDLQAGNLGKQIIRAYLSRAHFKDVENSCPMVALPTDVQRNGKAVKAAFESVFRAMVGALEQSARGGRRGRRERAQATAALCVGGLIVARTVCDEKIADELREACMSVALQILDAG